jgi:hypothetical protein
MVEWLFPMHIDRTQARLQRTEVLGAEVIDSHVT